MAKNFKWNFCCPGPTSSPLAPKMREYLFEKTIDLCDQHGSRKDTYRHKRKENFTSNITLNWNLILSIVTFFERSQPAVPRKYHSVGNVTWTKVIDCYPRRGLPVISLRFTHQLKVIWKITAKLIHLILGLSFRGSIKSKRYSVTIYLIKVQHVLILLVCSHHFWGDNNYESKF